MSEWIRLDRSKFAPVSVEEQIDGVTVSVTLSPHDVPVAVRGRFDTQHFIIEFKYLDDERTRAAVKDDGVVVYTGRYSDRVYAICLPKSLLEDHSKINLQIQMAIDALGYNGVSSNRRAAAEGNRKIAKEVVAQTSDQLFSIR